MYRILAVDYANLLYRSWWSAKTSGGPVGVVGIFRFFQSLYVSMRQLRCNTFLLAGESFTTLNRTKFDDSYKAGRKKPEDPEFQKFSKVLSNMLTNLGIPILHYSGFEGDDIIATICRECCWDRVYIMSQDKDLRQLLRHNHVSIALPDSNRTRFTYKSFEEEFGFSPEKYYIYKALVGDKSDNISGVDGIGPVLATVICSSDNIGESLNNVLNSEERRIQFNHALSLVKLNGHAPSKCLGKRYAWYDISNRQIRSAKATFIKAYGEKMVDGIVNEIRKIMTIPYVRSKIIAVDFDGTIVKNSWPDVGDVNDEVVQALRNEQAMGAKLVLWTCRTGAELVDAIEFCCHQGLVLDAVNENPPEVIQWLKGDSRKIFADEYWDDRAVPVVYDKNDKALLKRS